MNSPAVNAKPDPEGYKIVQVQHPTAALPKKRVHFVAVVP
jgi:hypothetical protein